MASSTILKFGNRDAQFVVFPPLHECWGIPIRVSPRSWRLPGNKKVGVTPTCRQLGNPFREMKAKNPQIAASRPLSQYDMQSKLLQIVTCEI